MTVREVGGAGERRAGDARDESASHRDGSAPDRHRPASPLDRDDACGASPLGDGLDGRLLAIDVGAGTADILLTQPGEPPENALKLVVPSRTRIVGRQIAAATVAGQTVVFRGPVMGGGASTAATKAHVRASLPFVATEEAALTFDDDLERARALGVRIVDEDEADELLRRLPAESVSEVRSGDVDAPALRAAIELLGVPPEFDAVAIAVQDHGFNPARSNRIFRFGLWREAVEGRRPLADLFWRGDEVPESLTRLRAAVAAASELAGGGAVLAADTGPAALYGALPAIADDAVLVNVGNGHTICVVARQGRLAGVFEHHTPMLDGPGLEARLRRYLAGELEDATVREDGGHGAVLAGGIRPNLASEPLIVTGPRRGMLCESTLPLVFAAPYGDMMLTGCFGLLRAYREQVEAARRT
jgi:uncharacterized protein (DUF1786 family)